MRSLRTILACAVPAVTALFGIFWLFNRRKTPPTKQITEPPDKDETTNEEVTGTEETSENKVDQMVKNEAVVSGEAVKLEKLAKLGCGDVVANVSEKQVVSEKQNESDEIISEIDNAFKDIYDGSELEDEAENEVDEMGVDEVDEMGQINGVESNIEAVCKDGLNLRDATWQSDISDIDQEKSITRQKADDLNLSSASNTTQTISERNVDVVEKDEICLPDEAIVAASVDALNVAPLSCSDDKQSLDSAVNKSEVIEDLVIPAIDQSLNAKTAHNGKLSKNVEETLVSSEQIEPVIESQIITEQFESQTSVPVDASSHTSQLSDISSKTETVIDSLQKEETNCPEVIKCDSQNKEVSNDNNDEAVTSGVSSEHNKSNELTEWVADQNKTNSWDEETSRISQTQSSSWVEEMSSTLDSGISSNSWVVNGGIEEVNSESLQQQTAIENVISRTSANTVVSRHGPTSSSAPGAYVSREKRGGSVNSSESSSNCDNSSVTSSGSSQGGSTPEILNHRPDDQEHIFEFNMPSDLCGLFIGTRGKTIKSIRDQSGAKLKLRNNPYTPDFQICVIEGTQSAIDKACNIIKRKFPAVKYPGIDMTPISSSPAIDMALNSSSPVLMPEIMQLSLPEGVSVDIVVSSIVDAGRIFIQQPTHPSYTSLDRLNHFMLQCYMQEGAVPDIPRPIENGVICAAPMLNGWYRAQIMAVYEETDECDIKYVDYGGYSRISGQCLKQIRSDFMTLPFEAVECYMANMTPLQGESYFSAEAAAVLEELTQGKLLQAQVVGRAEDGIPYVHIYQISGNTSALMVNREMVNRGVTRWIEILS